MSYRIMATECHFRNVGRSAKRFVWRERLRVVVRAWRECADAERVRPLGHGVLAAKLAQGLHAQRGCGEVRLAALGWHAQLLLGWMRLVRGTEGHGRRRRQRGEARQSVGSATAADDLCRLCDDDEPAAGSTDDARMTARRTRRNDTVLALTVRVCAMLARHLRDPQHVAQLSGRQRHAERARGDG